MRAKSFRKSALPSLGVGLSFRAEIAKDIYHGSNYLDALELILDIVRVGIVGVDAFRRAHHLPVIGHGTGGSIGTNESVDVDYFRTMGQIASGLGCPWFSEHLAFTKAADVEIDQLMPLLFSEANAISIATKIREARALLGLPFLVENIAYYFTFPGNTLTESQFICHVLELADCGLLLDINNLYGNALNFGADPYKFIDEMPPHRVIELHIAGGQQQDDLYIDTHGHPISQEVWHLLEYAISKTRPKAIILEREKNLPHFNILLAEVEEARLILQKANRLTTILT